MKSKVLLLLVIFSAMSLRAEREPQPMRLAGIIDLPGMKRAMFGRTAASRTWEEGVLAEGQRDGDVEVLNINAKNRTVTINRAGTKAELSFEPSPLNQFTLDLQTASLDQVLNVYGELAGRTVLRTPDCSNIAITLSAAPTNALDAARILEAAFLENSIVTIPDGKKFVMMLLKTQSTLFKPDSPAVQVPATNSSPTSITNATAPGEQLLPPGMIDIRGADINAVLVLCAELKGHTLDRSEPLGCDFKGVVLKTQTPLTREEAIYAVEKVLAFQGIKLVPSSKGEGMVKAVLEKP
jgi:hypothetical protein